jgi:hypothetical protein
MACDARESSSTAPAPPAPSPQRDTAPPPAPLPDPEPPALEPSPAPALEAVRASDGFGTAKSGDGKITVTWRIEAACAESGPAATVELRGTELTIRHRALPKGHRCIEELHAYRTTVRGLAAGVYQLHAPGFPGLSIRVSKSAAQLEMNAKTVAIDAPIQGRPSRYSSSGELEDPWGLPASK